MKARQYAFFCSLILIMGMICSLTACGKKEEERGKDWDYTVVPKEDCPKDFFLEIEKKKINSFQMTYEDGEYLYIAIGYGEQLTNGFGIQVQQLYEMGENLCIETSLIGPDKEQIVRNKASYPYVVIKTEKTSKKVKFFP